MEQKIPKLEEEKAELLKLLHSKQKEARKLSMEMESMIPSSDTVGDSSTDLQSSSSSSSLNTLLIGSTTGLQRWRTLPGTDPTSDELQQKIAKLEERINSYQKQLSDKELILQKAKAIVEKKEKQLDDVHNDAAALLAQVFLKKMLMHVCR